MSLVIRETQFIIYFGIYSIEWLRKTDHIKCWQGNGAARTLIYFCLECEIIQPPW